MQNKTDQPDISSSSEAGNLPEAENRPDGEPLAESAGKPERISIWRVLGTLLSLGLLIYLIRIAGWGEFVEAMKRLPLSTFLLAVGAVLLSRVCVTFRWLALLRSAGIKMSFLQAFRLVFMGNFSSNFLPSTVGGDLVRLAGAVYLRVDSGVAAASLVLDRLVGMAGMSSLAPLGLVMMLHPLPVAPGDALAPLSAGALAGLARIPGVGWVYRRTEKFVRSLLRSSVFWLRHPSSLLWALLCTFGHMLCVFLSIKLLLDGMHESLPFWWIGGLWSLSYFVSLLPISFNGLGLQELSISYLYTQFGGVSAGAGLALAVFMRMLFLLTSLPGALFLPDILRPMPSMSGSRSASAGDVDARQTRS